MWRSRPSAELTAGWLSPTRSPAPRRVELDRHRVEDAQQIEVEGGEIHGADNLHTIIQFQVSDDRTYVDPRRAASPRRLKQAPDFCAEPERCRPALTARRPTRSRRGYHHVRRRHRRRALRRLRPRADAGARGAERPRDRPDDFPERHDVGPLHPAGRRVLPAAARPARGPRGAWRTGAGNHDGRFRAGRSLRPSGAGVGRDGRRLRAAPLPVRPDARRRRGRGRREPSRRRQLRRTAGRRRRGSSASGPGHAAGRIGGHQGSARRRRGRQAFATREGGRRAGL